MLTKQKRNALALAAEAGVDPRTAARWLAGQPVMPGQQQALELAAKKLGIKRGLK